MEWFAQNCRFWENLERPPRNYSQRLWKEFSSESDCKHLNFWESFGRKKKIGNVLLKFLVPDIFGVTRFVIF
jgi:hypothetical protein